MGRDEQRVNGDELKPLAYRAARHRLNPFVSSCYHTAMIFPPGNSQMRSRLPTVRSWQNERECNAEGGDAEQQNPKPPRTKNLNKPLLQLTPKTNLFCGCHTQLTQNAATPDR
jgi:hypothetical protein